MLADVLLLFLRPVDLRVTDVVAHEPVGVAVEEDRPLARTCVLERLLRCLVDRCDVLSVDLDRCHSVCLGALRQVADRRVLRLGRRLRPLVVLEHEDRRDLPELRHVQGFMEGADVRRTVAEERNSDARLTAKLERECRTGDLRQSASDHRIRAHVPALDVVEVHRPAVPVRTAFELPVQLRHQFVRRRPLRERMSVGAVGRGDDVAFLERPTDTHRNRFLADGHMQKPGKLARADALLLLTVADDARSDWAAALLGPANPGRLGKKIHFTIGRRGAAVGPEGARRLLRRLDDEGVDGKLELLGAEKALAEELLSRESLREAWQRALDSLPPDWSDIYAEVRFDSTDYVERAALLLAPLNPARHGGATALRFRCARSFGYGVSPEMAARCLQRCDEDGLTGEVEILRALSDTSPVSTQGPVWRVGGRGV